MSYFLLEDGASRLLEEDGASGLLLEATSATPAAAPRVLIARARHAPRRGAAAVGRVIPAAPAAATRPAAPALVARARAPARRGAATVTRPVPAAPPAVWTYAGNKVGGNTSATTLALTLPNPVAAGDLIAVGVVTWNGTALTSGQVSVADNKGNGPYNLAVWETGNGTANVSTGVFWLTAATGGSSFQVTITSTVSAFLTGMVGEFAHTTAGAVAVDSAAGAHGLSASPSFGPLAVAGTDLVFAAINATGKSETNPT